jgi:hypothetical protein
MSDTAYSTFLSMLDSCAKRKDPERDRAETELQRLHIETTKGPATA